MRKALLITGIGLAGLYAAAIGVIYELERESHNVARSSSRP
jgi:hypothetical protein